MQRGAMGSEPAIPLQASPSFAPDEDRWERTQWGDRSLKARRDYVDARIVRKQTTQQQVLQRVERDQRAEAASEQKKLQRKAATEEAFVKSRWELRYKGKWEKYIPPLPYRPVVSLSVFCGEEM